MKVSNVTVRRRLFSALIIAVVAFFLLAVRLGYVQLWKGSELSAKAENSWRREIPFSAKRGEILDRNGEKLAYNTKFSDHYGDTRANQGRQTDGRESRQCARSYGR